MWGFVMAVVVWMMCVCVMAPHTHNPNQNSFVMAVLVWIQTVWCFVMAVVVWIHVCVGLCQSTVVVWIQTKTGHDKAPRCLDGVCVVLCHGCFGLDCVCVQTTTWHDKVWTHMSKQLCHDCCCLDDPNQNSHVMAPHTHNPNQNSHGVCVVLCHGCFGLDCVCVVWIALSWLFWFGWCVWCFVMAVLVWIQTTTALSWLFWFGLCVCGALSWLFWFGLCVCGALTWHHTHTIVCVWCKAHGTPNQNRLCVCGALSWLFWFGLCVCGALSWLLLFG